MHPIWASFILNQAQEVVLLMVDYIKCRNVHKTPEKPPTKDHNNSASHARWVLKTGFWSSMSQYFLVFFLTSCDVLNVTSLWYRYHNSSHSSHSVDVASWGSTQYNVFRISVLTAFNIYVFLHFHWCRCKTVRRPRLWVVTFSSKFYFLSPFHQRSNKPPLPDNSTRLRPNVVPSTLIGSFLASIFMSFILAAFLGFLPKCVIIA